MSASAVPNLSERPFYVSFGHLPYLNSRPSPVVRQLLLGNEGIILAERGARQFIIRYLTMQFALLAIKSSGNEDWYLHL
jgi:hypothetical protein